MIGTMMRSIREAMRAGRLRHHASALVAGGLLLASAFPLHAARLTFSDALDYLAHYAAGRPAADLDGDGRVGTADFLEFVSRYSRGVARPDSDQPDDGTPAPVWTRVRRFFMKGNQWARNGTLDHLVGFDAVRVSSYVTPEVMRAVDESGKLLFVGLAAPVAPPDSVYPGEVLEAYPDSGALAMFEDWLTDLRDEQGVEPAVLTYNLEVRARIHEDHGGPSVVSAAYADLVRRYRTVMKAVLPESELWVYSSYALDGWERPFYSCDWDLLTRGDGGVDACMIGFTINPLPGQASSEARRLSEALFDTRALTNDRPVVWQAMTFEAPADDPTVREVRNTSHLYWESFKSIIRRTMVAAARANGGRTPAAFYPQHAGAQIAWEGEPLRVDYSLDGYGTAPEEDLPWPTGGAYPARIWSESGPVGQWDWTDPGRLANRWEAELQANFLAATGEVFGPVYIEEDTVWRGAVTLLGDVVVTGGATLTLEAGTHVRFRPRTDLSESGADPGRAEVVVTGGGRLQALGTADRPVVFGSAAPEPVPGDWYGIRNLDGRLALTHCVIEDAAHPPGSFGGDPDDTNP